MFPVRLDLFLECSCKIKDIAAGNIRGKFQWYQTWQTLCQISLKRFVIFCFSFFDWLIHHRNLGFLCSYLYPEPGELWRNMCVYFNESFTHEIFWTTSLYVKTETTASSYMQTDPWTWSDHHYIQDFINHRLAVGFTLCLWEWWENASEGGFSVLGQDTPPLFCLYFNMSV